MQITEFPAMKQAVPVKSQTERRAEFNEKYKDWIAEQCAQAEQYGVFGEEFRPW